MKTVKTFACPVLLAILLAVVLVLIARLWPSPAPAEPQQPPAPTKYYVDGMSTALDCMTLNLYKEARGETLRGQQAVVKVVLNRVRATNYEKDVCDIILAPKQFSWTITDMKNGQLLPEAMPDRNSKTWKKVRQVALDAMYTKDFTGGATHYHEKSIQPDWSLKLSYVGEYGNHLFYR